MVEKIKQWARKLKADIAVLYLAYRNAGTPWYAKLAALITVGYALSPIDLIPDFVPILGFVDDAILLPILIWLSLKLIPPEVIAQCRESADEVFAGGRPKSYLAAGVIVLVWILLIAYVITRLIK